MPESVVILDERINSMPLPNGSFLQMIELTYQAAGTPPRRVFIPKEEDSPQARQKAIKADLDSIAGTRGTRIDIP